MAESANTFYHCDPFTPGIYLQPKRISDFFANPLAFFGTELPADLVGDNGEVLAAAGTKVIEIGAVASFHQFDRSKWGVHGRLYELSTEVDALGDILQDPATTGVHAEDYAVVAEHLGHTLPATVVAHTRRSVGDVAVRDFGFKIAGTIDSMPPGHQEAIAATGESPVTLYMPSQQFRAMEPPAAF
ncbi:MAG TPA: hypothetical protein VD735_07455 [Candidatus Saccharimonadales bacterium]|nr:hypothetical protein [Candidatus Saccharimonadales bacterium]